MLLWINGPFGGGKTVTAFELQRRLDDAVVCDPERIGFGLQRTLPRHLRVDFQDLKSWRAGVVEVLDLTLCGHPGPVIAPMTLVEPTYFEQIVGGLRGNGHDVRHFALLPSAETVRNRLMQRRLGGLRPEPTWALDRVEPSLSRLRTPEFAVHVETDGKSVAHVAEEIAEHAGLALSVGTDGPVRSWLRRTATSVRHVRLGLGP